MKFAKYAEEQGHRVSKLFGWMDTRTALALTLFGDFDLVYYSGHGSINYWLGNDPLFKLLALDNADWVRGKAVVGVPVCLSASELGRKVVEQGGLVFMGSTDLMWVALSEQENDYKRDFEDCWMTLLKAILEDRTFNEALEAYRQKTAEYLELYRSKLGEWPNVDFYMDSLRKNSEYYTVIGRGDLRLSEVEASVKPTMVDFIASDLRRGGLSLSVTLAIAAATVAAPIVIPIAEKELRARKILTY